MTLILLVYKTYRCHRCVTLILFNNDDDDAADDDDDTKRTSVTHL